MPAAGDAGRESCEGMAWWWWWWWCAAPRSSSVPIPQWVIVYAAPRIGVKIPIENETKRVNQRSGKRMYTVKHLRSENCARHSCLRHESVT